MHAPRREPSSSVTLVCTPPGSDLESLPDVLVLLLEATGASLHPTPPSVTLSYLSAHHRMICALTSLRAEHMKFSVPQLGNQ
jgi:hypothetical protein